MTLSTVLPLAWPAMVRADGKVFLGLQVQSRSGDVSRDLAHALELALAARPAPACSRPVCPVPAPGCRTCSPTSRSRSQLHDGFDYWVEGAPDPTGEVAASMERANASVVPTARLSSVESAYWCRMRAKTHLRWVLPHEEDRALDALARLSAAGALGIGRTPATSARSARTACSCPSGTRPHDREADAMEEPTAALRTRLDEALADERPLTVEERRARSGLLSRQLTLNA